MSISFGRKSCATCSYWQGEREIYASGSGAKCKDWGSEGTCGNPKSMCKNKKVKASYISCNK